ncbi:hypothetical protein HUU62_01805 [Rhodoferax sp. 4810]|uniref:Uncharacterized protein n=1 Tax=Thiospirillum jenense TaxID=1653858 RepID=A0A839H488_9GAMM|nr:hypothetical protein [Thiospirillum jenense]MBB1073148.1 hypothetical protein [Rhodoferax jenense]MBB1124691.1 hypothetical protein [Thiospirillum jenense]
MTRRDSNDVGSAMGCGTGGYDRRWAITLRLTDATGGADGMVISFIASRGGIGLVGGAAE